MMDTKDRDIRADAPRLWRAWGIVIAIAFAIITSYYHQYVYVTLPNAELAVRDHLSVVNGSAMAPTQYRFAPYFIAQAILDLAVSHGAPNNSDTLLHVYLAIQIVVMSLAYYLLLVFLGRWFEPTRAVLGLCFLVAVNPLAEYQYYLQPGDCWSFLLFLLGYLAMASSRDGWLYPIILIGVPFRETIGLLIPAWICLRWGKIPTGKLIVHAIVFSIAFLGPYVLEHLAYGNRENYVTTRQEWARDQSTFLYNLRRIDGWIVLLLYFNVLWAAIFLKWKELPRFIRRVFIIVPLSLVSFLYLGRIVEGRLYLPILPLFLPAGLMMLESSVASRSVPPNGEPNQG